MICKTTLKVCFSSKRLAKKAIDSFNKQVGENRLKTTYKCGHCSMWHNSSMDPNKATRISERIKHREQMKVDKSNHSEYIDKRLEYLLRKNRMK